MNAFARYVAAACVMLCVPGAAMAQSGCQPVWDAKTAWQDATDAYFAYDPWVLIEPAELYRGWCIQNAQNDAIAISDCNNEFEAVERQAWDKYYELSDAMYLAEFNYHSAVLNAEAQGLSCY